MATKKLKTESGTKPEVPAARDAAPATQDAKRRPLKTFREGDVSATIWPRQTLVRGEQRNFYSLTFERSYKIPGQPWKYTRSFDVSDLGNLGNRSDPGQE